MQLLPDPPGLRAHGARGTFGGRGAIAQLGERLVCNQKVAGSIPAGSTSSLPPAMRDTRDDASSCEHFREAYRRRLRAPEVAACAGVIARFVA